MFSFLLKLFPLRGKNSSIIKKQENKKEQKKEEKKKEEESKIVVKVNEEAKKEVKINEEIKKKLEIKELEGVKELKKEEEKKKEEKKKEQKKEKDKKQEEKKNENNQSPTTNKKLDDKLLTFEELKKIDPPPLSLDEISEITNEDKEFVEKVKSLANKGGMDRNTALQMVREKSKSTTYIFRLCNYDPELKDIYEDPSLNDVWEKHKSKFELFAEMPPPCSDPYSYDVSTPDQEENKENISTPAPPTVSLLSEVIALNLRARYGKWKDYIEKYSSQLSENTKSVLLDESFALLTKACEYHSFYPLKSLCIFMMEYVLQKTGINGGVNEDNAGEIGAQVIKYCDPLIDKLKRYWPAGAMLAMVLCTEIGDMYYHSNIDFHDLFALTYYNKAWEMYKLVKHYFIIDPDKSNKSVNAAFKGESMILNLFDSQFDLSNMDPDKIMRKILVARNLTESFNNDRFGKFSLFSNNANSQVGGENKLSDVNQNNQSKTGIYLTFNFV